MVNYILLKVVLYLGVVRRGISWDLIYVHRNDFKTICSDSSYKEWTKKTNGKARIIEQPNKKLAYVQKRLHEILRRIETPSYLMSGKRGIRPVDNALFHKEGAYVVNVDIASFFKALKENLFTNVLLMNFNKRVMLHQFCQI